MTEGEKVSDAEESSSSDSEAENDAYEGFGQLKKHSQKVESYINASLVNRIAEDDRYSQIGQLEAILLEICADEFGKRFNKLLVQETLK